MSDGATRCWNCGVERAATASQPQPQQTQPPEKLWPAAIGCLVGALIAVMALALDPALFHAQTAATAWLTVVAIVVIAALVLLIIPIVLHMPQRESAFARGIPAGVIAGCAAMFAVSLLVMGILSVCNQLFKNV